MCRRFSKEFIFGLDSTDRDCAACLAQQSSLPGGNQLAVWLVVRYLWGLCWPRCQPCLPDAPFPQVSTLQLARPGSSKRTGLRPETCWMMPEPEKSTDKHVCMHCMESIHWTRQTVSTDKTATYCTLYAQWQSYGTTAIKWDKDRLVLQWGSIFIH